MKFTSSIKMVFFGLLTIGLVGCDRIPTRLRILNYNDSNPLVVEVLSRNDGEILFSGPINTVGEHEFNLVGKGLGARDAFMINSFVILIHSDGGTSFKYDSAEGTSRYGPHWRYWTPRKPEIEFIIFDSQIVPILKAD